MKKLAVLLVAGLLVHGCGSSVRFSYPNGQGQNSSGVTNVTITIDPSPITSAQAEITACPAGMTLVNATAGSHAFCIDSQPNSTVTQVVHSNALTSCTTAGRDICSAQEMSLACAAGDVNAAYNYWTNHITGVSSPYAILFSGSTCQGAGPIALSGNPVRPYYCCQR